MLGFTTNRDLYRYKYYGKDNVTFHDKYLDGFKKHRISDWGDTKVTWQDKQFLLYGVALIKLNYTVDSWNASVGDHLNSICMVNETVETSAGEYAMTATGYDTRDFNNTMLQAVRTAPNPLLSQIPDQTVRQAVSEMTFAVKTLNHSSIDCEVSDRRCR